MTRFCLIIVVLIIVVSDRKNEILRTYPKNFNVFMMFVSEKKN